MGYDTGGSGSSPEAAGFLRIMKNHTAAGMAMKIKEFTTERAENAERVLFLI